MNPILLTLIRFLHDFFTVVWFGGLFASAISFMPAVRLVHREEPAKRQQIMTTYNQKQSRWVIASMVILIVTGLILSKQNPHFVRLFSFANTYSVVLSLKHLLILALIGLSLYNGSLMRKTDGGPALEKKRKQLMLVNLVLAVLILLTSATSAGMV